MAYIDTSLIIPLFLLILISSAYGIFLKLYVLVVTSSDETIPSLLDDSEVVNFKDSSF